MTTDQDTRMLRAALAYAANGWHVFPLKPRSKRPATPHGFKDATVDPERIRRYWWRNPQANIAIATGAVSGILVVDIDGPKARKWWGEWRLHNGTVHTLWQRTGRADGGMQLVFAHPGTGELPNRTAAAPDVDVRGDGGYIVVAPSVHPDTGQRYRWAGRAPIAPMPATLLAMLYPSRTQGTPAKPVGVQKSTTAYVDAALQSEYDDVCISSPGTRNDRLNRAAFSLGQLVGAALVDENLVTESLLEAGQIAGLGPRECLRTISSGLRAGMQNPREVAER